MAIRRFMRRWLLRLTAGYWTRGFLALGALLVLGQAQARASCGTHTFFSFQEFRSSQTSEQTSESNKPQATSQNSHKPVETPCRGPFCSSNSAPQGLPVTSSTTSGQDHQWSCIVAHLVLLGDQRVTWLALQPTAPGTNQADPIFHPPRQLAA